ncbi:hypothetical protein JP75_20430 [Devosia riboflavina]|uniref:Helicase n=1 Tax=Devosia riboflavina TaxID=46914 RepID=A0A087LY37_9HYPH|nr:DEAD/DEAH box helicase [Devosia riboflavina]KFL29540.1 hypothetical protein JP75_20430 [Devosia riboflavina]
MFDEITSRIISSSPALTGLDLDALPKRLTEAYADIVTARITLRQAGSGASARLSETVSELRRLAAAHEAHVALHPDYQTRVAAAFVAASAHQAVLLAKSESERNASFLSGSGIAPEVSASLLFLAADAHADAAECAKRIVVDGGSEGTVIGRLLTSIRLLCQGRLDAVRQLDIPTPTSEERAERAIEFLYLELYKGVQSLSARILSRIDVPVAAGGIEPASNTFNRVRELSSADLSDAVADHAIFSTFSGPSHLANLLLAVDRDLGGSALARTPPPKGVDGNSWWNILRRMARKRPYLWRNHRDAIASGYLEPGISAAISFPTGGGKSTLAELKVAASLLRKKKVVFLVPTHALVDQTTRALKETFSDFEIIGDVEDETSAAELIELPEVIVTTPERCLMILSSQPEAFTDLGLVAFDECHLLHPREIEKSRRSVDSMLAVLNLAAAAKGADFLLLSAMMKNAEEISGWIAMLTERPCLPLNIAWKPTRQVRGCVVYSSSAIDSLNDVLAAARLDHPKTNNLPVKIARTLNARPYGFFSLRQTWASQDRNDYALLSLFQDEHRLSTGKGTRGWYLTPNGNHTGAILAASSSKGGMKTLLFVQTVPWAESAAAEVRQELSAPPVLLTDEEAATIKLAEEEMGGRQYLYTPLDEEGALLGRAVTHHSMLLREERSVHESLFKRNSGVNVLVATSTVAQGMNFPAEVVLISGDSRFDPSENKLAQLEAHELLNAAGRAGRAGESSQGLVLVVPSRVVSFDDKTNLISSHWMTLQSIFSQSDQCLDIEDPLTRLLDDIHAGTFGSGMPAYLLSRLPHVENDDPKGDQKFQTLLRGSFAAFKAKARGDDSWVTTRIETARAARKSMVPDGNPTWLESVAGLTGVPVAVLQELNALFPDEGLEIETMEAIDRIFSWLEKNPLHLFSLVRPENVDDLFGTSYEKLDSDIDRANMALPVIHELLRLWMMGLPLSSLEAIYPDRPDTSRCKHARHFSLRLVPDLAFAAGLPGRLVTARRQMDPNSLPIGLILETLGTCVKEGADSPEVLSARIALGRGISRPAARARYEELAGLFAPREADETFEETLHRFRQARVLEGFSSLED